MCCSSRREMHDRRETGGSFAHRRKSERCIVNDYLMLQIYN